MKIGNWRTKAVYLLIAAVLAIGLVPGIASVAAAGSSGETLTCYVTVSRTSAPLNGQVTINGYVLPPGVVPDTISWSFGAGWVLDTGSTTTLGPIVGHWTTSGLKTVRLHVEVTGTARDLDGRGWNEVLVDNNVLEPTGLEHNILGDWATFTVPAGDTRTVLGWRIEEQDQIDVSVRTGTGDPGDRSIDVHCAALDSDYEGGAAYIYADMTPNATAPDYYRAEKKWGKINDTILWPFLYDSYRELTPASTRSSEVVWNESAKRFEGGIYMLEVVIGSYDVNPTLENPEGLLEVPASGAIVHWWLVDGSADLSTIPASGDFATLADAIDALPDANLVTFDVGGTYTTTTSGDVWGGNVEGVTGMSVEAWGEESVYIIVVATYPDDLSTGGQYPVFPEIESWNFWTQQLEKVPQVRWAGEEIVLEKAFGTSYIGCPVDFVIEGNSPGALESVGLPGDENEGGVIHTYVDATGVARAILGSEEPGEADVTALLYGRITGGGEQPLSQGALINKHGFVVFFLKLESIELGNVPGERVDNPLTMAVEGHDSGLFLADDPESQEYGPWDAGLDTTADVLNVSADTLLRATVKGWFMGDDLSTRDELELDTDGDGEADITLPEGRWVLPDDWYKLAGGRLWEELRPHWDLMDQPNDNIMSGPDGDLYWNPVLMRYVLMAAADKVEEQGPYYEWLENPLTGVSMIIGLAAMPPVIGPYSSLDNYTPFVNAPLLDRKTIVSNGELNKWDCPMPPAKIVFEITGRTDIGYFKEVDKGDVYYHFEWTTLSDVSILYTNPYYAEMIPASDLIPPFVNNGGYDWDSWNDAYGPYDFWEFINQPDQGIAPSDPTHPTKVEVYSDNHGEAMVWLNGDWNLNINGQGSWWDELLGDWTTDPWVDTKTGDLWEPIGWEAWTHIASQGGIVNVGGSTVEAMADYPYLRKHQPIVSDTVEKTWTWGKTKLVDVYQLPQIQGAPLYGQKLILVWLTDRDGMPAVGEEILWKLPNNGATILGFLSGTDGIILDPLQKVGMSETRLPGPEEMAYWVASHGDIPCNAAVAGLIVLGTDPAVQSTLLLEMAEREGTLYHAEVLDFGIPGQVDPELTAGMNIGVYEGPTQSVVAATSSIASNLVAIWWQDDTGKWHAYQPGAPAWANDLSELSYGNLYWINVSQNCLWNWEFVS